MMLSLSLLVLVATAPMSYANEEKFRQLAKIGLDAFSGIPAVRELQTVEGLNEYEVLNGLLGFFFSKCEDEFNALASNPTPEAITDLVLCVKDATIDLVDSCFLNFPGFFNPLECVADLAITEENIALLLESGIIDEIEYFDPEYLPTEIPYELDLSEFIDLSIFSPIDGITSDQCSAALGTASAPKFASCLSLIKIQDIENFLIALEDNFFEDVNGCSPLRNVFGVDNGEEVTIDLGDAIDLTIISDGLDAGYTQNFAACSELDDGALSDELNERFVERSTSSANIAKANLVVGLAMILAAILN